MVPRNILKEAAAASRQLAMVYEGQVDVYKEAMSHAFRKAGTAKDQFTSRRWIVVAQALDFSASKYVAKQKEAHRFAAQIDFCSHRNEELEDTEMPVVEHDHVVVENGIAESLISKGVTVGYSCSLCTKLHVLKEDAETCLNNCRRDQNL